VKYTRYAFLLLSAWGPTTFSQSLDEQYDFFLGTGNRRCEHMNFEVDADLVLLPGQAGPRLAEFCSGVPPVGGPSSSGAIGAGTGASNDRGVEDSAVRRRRERMRREGATSADARGEEITLMESGNAAVFFSLDYQYEKQRATRYEAEHRSHSASGTLGFDYRFAGNGLAGVAIKYEDLSGDYAGPGGFFDVRGVGALLYGSWQPLPTTFVDIGAGIVERRLDVQRVVGIRHAVIGAPGAPPLISYHPGLAPVDSRTDGRELNAQVLAGYDKTAGRFTIGPRLGISIKRSTTDGFTERGATPMTLVVDERRDTSTLGSVGVHASAAFNASFGALLPQLSIDWLYEFDDDGLTITARFAEDLRPNPSRLRYRMNAPDADTVRAQFSTVAVLAHGLSAFVAVEALLAHDYRDRIGATIGIRKEL
jgi:hypothetical protein